MTIEQIITDIGAGIAAIGAISTIIAHLPFVPAKYAEFFARLSLYAANWKFSVNQRDTLPKKPSVPPSSLIGPMGGMLLCFVIALGLSGCGLFGSASPFWPEVKDCAPSPATLVSQVEDVLLAGGDYEAALKQIALQDGAAAVECAVAAAVDELSSKVGASPDAQPAAARGKAFLLEHQVSK